MMASMALYRRGYSHLINILFTIWFRLPSLENWKAVTRTLGDNGRWWRPAVVLVARHAAVWLV